MIILAVLAAFALQGAPAVQDAPAATLREQAAAVDHLDLLIGTWTGVEWNGNIIYYRFERLDADTVRGEISYELTFPGQPAEMWITREGEHLVVRRGSDMWRSVSVTDRFVEFETVRGRADISWHFRPGRIEMTGVNRTNPEFSYTMVLRQL